MAVESNLDSALKDAFNAMSFILGTEDALEGIMAFVKRGNQSLRVNKL